MRSMKRERYGDEVAHSVLVLLTDEVSSVLVRGQLHSLVSHGFDVRVGVRRSNPDAPSPFDDGVAVHHLDYVRQPSPVADMRALVQTARLVRNLRPDIVHASTPKAGLLGMIAAWVCRVPARVYQVRGLRYETETGIKQRLYSMFEWVAIHCATHVLFNSASLLSIAEADGVIASGRGIVLGSGNGVASERFSPANLVERRNQRSRLSIPDDARVIGFVGRLTTDKGIGALVDAFKSIAVDDVWLLLVGPFETGDALSRDVRTRIEAHPRIVHIDWIDDPRIVYSAIDVLAFPSYREGLPNVPLEAQACGIPIVGYAATGTVDAVVDGETGLLVTVGDRAAFTQALRTVLDDHDLRKQLGAQARAHVVTSFQPHDVWAKIEAVYRSALER